MVDSRWVSRGNQEGPSPASPPVRGPWCTGWQVKASNHRSFSRWIYRPTYAARSPAATRLTSQFPAESRPWIRHRTSRRQSARQGLCWSGQVQLVVALDPVTSAAAPLGRGDIVWHRPGPASRQARRADRASPMGRTFGTGTHAPKPLCLFPRRPTTAGGPIRRPAMAEQAAATPVVSGSVVRARR